MTDQEAIEAALGPEGYISYLRGKAIEYYWRPLTIDNPAQAARNAESLAVVLSCKIENYIDSLNAELTQPPLKANDDRSSIKSFPLNHPFYNPESHGIDSSFRGNGCECPACIPYHP